MRLIETWRCSTKSTEHHMNRPAVILIAMISLAPADGFAQRSSIRSNVTGTTTRTTGAIGISRGQRWGTPGSGGYPSTVRPSSSPPWTLRMPTSNGRSPGITYSAGSGRSIAYGNNHGHVHYNNHGSHYGIRSYGISPIYNGLSIQYSSGYWPGIGYGYTPNYDYLYGPPAIIAPPITIPYGGYSVAPFVQVLPSANQFLDAPAPGQISMEIPPAPFASNNAAANEVLPMSENGELLSQQLPSDETPVLNEFGDQYKAIPATEVSTANRIRSLRYQASGDHAFRNKELDSAEAFYKAASETAAVRRAPWLRLAWVQLAQEKREQAVTSLKTALHLKDDVTSSWVDGKDLFGAQFENDTVELEEGLWRWLQQRPNSTDRLLLVAAFQQLKGYDGIAKELTDAASRNGLDRSVASALRQISEANGRPVANPPNAEGEAEAEAGLPDRSIADDGGIRMQGRTVIPSGGGKVPVAEERSNEDNALGSPEQLSPAEILPAVDGSSTTVSPPLTPSKTDLQPVPVPMPELSLKIPSISKPKP